MQYSNIHFIYTTFFGLGKVSGRIAGTIGSIVAFPVAFYIVRLSKLINGLMNLGEEPWHYLIVPIIILLAMFICGVISSNHYIKAVGKVDPKEVIIDEIVGQSLCLIATVPITFLFMQQYMEKIPFDLMVGACFAANLVLFRIFDIFKPWPINAIERKLPNGLGIMLDDVMAAIFSIIVYYLIFFRLIAQLQ